MYIYIYNESRHNNHKLMYSISFFYFFKKYFLTTYVYIIHKVYVNTNILQKQPQPFKITFNTAENYIKASNSMNVGLTLEINV